MALEQKNRQLLVNTPLGENFLLLAEFSASETISEDVRTSSAELGQA